MSFWTHVVVDPDRTATADDCAAMLPDLHAALDRYPGELPAIGAGTVNLPRWLGMLDAGTDEVPGESVARVRAAADRLRPLLDGPTHTWRALHGDAHAGNPARHHRRAALERLRGGVPWACGVGPRDHRRRRRHPRAPPARPRRAGRLPAASDAADRVVPYPPARPVRRPARLGRRYPRHHRSTRSGYVVTRAQQDTALVEAARAGDEAAFAALSERHRPGRVRPASRGLPPPSPASAGAAAGHQLGDGGAAADRSRADPCPARRTGRAGRGDRPGPALAGRRTRRGAAGVAERLCQVLDLHPSVGRGRAVALLWSRGGRRLCSGLRELRRRRGRVRRTPSSAVPLSGRALRGVWVSTPRQGATIRPIS